MTLIELLNTKEAAILCGTDEATIRLAIRQGELRAWQLPTQRGMLVRNDDLKAWLKGRENDKRYRG